MYISYLSIKNFRNFTSFDINLYPFTLIIGENNTGKSNMLEAICLILGQEITTFKKRMLEIDDINYQAIKEFKRQIFDTQVPIDRITFPEVKVEIVMTELNEDQEAVVGDWFIDGDLKQAKLTYLFSLRQGWQKREEWILAQRMNAQEKKNIELIGFPIEEYEYQIFGGNSQQNKVDPYFHRMLKMELLDALRDAKRELVASGEYKLLYRILNSRDQEQYATIKDALLEFETKVKNNPEFQCVQNEIKAYLDRISLQENNLDNSVALKFISPELSEVLRKLSLVYGLDPIGVERNGLGRNNLLYISLVLSHLAGKSNGADHTFFRLVGIEEPESHLHPHLQHHLSKNIKDDVSNSLQIILTSHSPCIASNLALENTYILYKDNNGDIRKHNLVEGIDPESDTVHYLRKFLNATNSEMFFAKKVILVEGIAEQLLIPKFFEIYTGDKTLEKIGCNIVNVQGLAFKHFLEIIKNGYFIKCSVITDNDGTTRAHDLKTSYESGNNVIKVFITNQSTFEKELIETNKKGSSKSTLFGALCKTRPLSGPKLRSFTGSNDIDIDIFFEEIEKYKSEFAYDLLNALQNNKGILIPQYIKDSFDHILSIS
jgi:predicted ATP-dependent endonuclease of OLD family